MKRLFLGRIAVTGKVAMVVLALSAAAVAIAAPTRSTGAGDFNHMTTGFPLSGGHATAACETCHVGGVFKGTPKNCDGCHAVGKRVVATPKSNSHIVTDAPCENCHFNTATFLGARFNHGTAKPGQCSTCHNGRQSTAKPTSHSSGKKATESCDNCHRTYAWSPASWNHIGVSPGTCTNCHGVSSIGKPAGHTSIPKATYQCDECHSFLGWSPAGFKHNTAKVCSSCHDGTTAMTKGPTHIATTSECNVCHRTTTTWLGASFHAGNVAGICGTCHNGTNGVVGKPPLHIPTTGNNCDICHTSTTSFATWTMNHASNGNTTSCNACHATSSPAYPGIRTRKTIGSHKDSKAGQDCVNCHDKGISWSE